MNRLLPLLLLAGCTAATSAPEPVSPQHQLTVLSVKCDPNYGRPRADITVQNVGQTTIEYARGVVSFGGSMQDGYFSPRPLRPGGVASLTTYANMGESVDCSLTSVVDSEGFAASLR